MNSDSPFCGCDETRLGDGTRIPKPAWHDCEYVRRRNRLITQAEAEATLRCSHLKDSADGLKSYPYEWTRIFSETMDRLARPLLRGEAQ